MTTISMPPYPTGTAAQIAARQYSYLFQMAQQLNLALEALESGAAVQGQGGVQQSPAGNAVAALQQQYENLRSQIIKTAQQVEKTTESLTAKLNGFDHQQSFAEGCAKAVHKADAALRIIVPKLSRCHFSRSI